MLTGTAPFYRKTKIAQQQRLANGERLSPEKLNEKIPDELKHVIDCCLSIDPENRYGNGGELAHALANTADKQKIILTEDEQNRLFKAKKIDKKQNRFHQSTIIPGVLAGMTGFIGSAAGAIAASESHAKDDRQVENSFTVEHIPQDNNIDNMHLKEEITMTLKSIHEAPKAWGLPPVDINSPFVQQGYEDTCAIRSQQLILQDFGITASEEQLVQLAYEQGWYGEGGTSMADVGKILEAYGIPVNRTAEGNIFSLTSELAQGHRVMVAVDSGELWEDGFPEQLADLFGDNPDHALIVAGIDTSDPENITVQLMDPGTGDVAKSYPMDQFMDAWKDSGFYMVSTAEPAPPWAFGMDNFEYTDYLHLPNVGGVPYSEFERFHALANQHNDEGHFLDQLTQGFSDLMQGKTSLPEMLGSLFEDGIPAPDEVALPDNIQSELSTLAGIEEGMELFDNSNSEAGWYDHYNDLADYYGGWGDQISAQWYADQAAQMTDDSSDT